MVINIIVADDHHLIRKGLISELGAYEDISIIGEAINGDVALNLLRSLPRSVLLLDMDMPKVSGMEVLQRIKQECIDVQTIVLSMYDEDEAIVSCIEAGAQGFVSKEEDTDKIYFAIKSIVQNGFYFGEKTNKAMLNKLLKKNHIKPIFPLHSVTFSDRELQFLRALSRELTTTEIAAEMLYSPRTIESIRQDLIHRVGVRNGIGLILYAINHGYINLEPDCKPTKRINTKL